MRARWRWARIPAASADDEPRPGSRPWDPRCHPLTAASSTAGVSVLPRAYRGTLDRGAGVCWLVEHPVSARASQEAYALSERQLRTRGVHVRDLGDLVLRLQQPFVPGLTIEECVESVQHVLSKREVYNAVLTGIAIDELAERGALPEPLLSTVRHDDPLYGIDEVLALSIVNIYGSIGFTNFGYLDKVKPGVVGRVDRRGHAPGRCNTFLDDLIAAVVAAAASRIAHNHRDTLGEGVVAAEAEAVPSSPVVAGGGRRLGPAGTG